MDEDDIVTAHRRLRRDGGGPDKVDSLPSTSGEPEGWHVREQTPDGYPLMGSSPAEREDSLMRVLDSRAQGMRDHGFEGEGRYCGARIGFRPTGSPEAGTITGWVGCGYPHDMHPIPEPEPMPEAYVIQATYLMRGPS